MHVRTLGALFASAILGGGAQDLAGQGDTTGFEACRRAFRRQFPSERISLPDPCHQLAGAIIIEGNAARYLGIDPDSAISPRDLQQRNSGDAATGGSVAQGEAVPTVQPMAIGGGSLGAVGSDGGADAITALTINPAIFFTSPHAREAVARASRLADVTVFFPVDRLDRDGDGDIDYFGVRVRINSTGLRAGSRVMQRARESFDRLLSQEAADAERLAAAFHRAPDVERCVAALRAQPPQVAAIDAACGADARARPDEAQYEQFRRELAVARELADASYLGLDLRLDFGDPTLGAVPNASATAITAAVAFGRQFVDSNTAAASVGIKGRLGLRFTNLDSVSANGFAVDAGLGFEARRPLDLQRAITLSGGFEGRFGGEAQLEAEQQTNQLVFRAALSIPLGDASGVALAVGAPLIGTGASPTLVVKVDWGLLLPSLLPRLRS